MRELAIFALISGISGREHNYVEWRDKKVWKICRIPVILCGKRGLATGWCSVKKRGILWVDGMDEVEKCFQAGSH